MTSTSYASFTSTSTSAVPFIEYLYTVHQHNKRFPARTTVWTFADKVVGLLFPQLSDQYFQSSEHIAYYYKNIEKTLSQLVSEMASVHTTEPVSLLCDKFMHSLPTVQQMLLSDAIAIVSGDPAATNLDEVIRTYPGFYAIAVYRIAHELHKLHIPYIPRIMTEYAHARTGIDINPGARIGGSFFIDHGTGIVIGETTSIGENVKIYQGVTLGALNVMKDMAHIKRHPTIQDNVVIYAGATILGGETVIGHNCLIGGNAWITKSVPPYSKVYYKEHQRIISKEMQPVLGSSLEE